MRKILLILVLPGFAFADRLGSLKSTADVLLTTQAVSGASSSLETMVNGVRVSSPTASVNLVAGTNVTLSGSLTGGGTAQVTINASGGGTPASPSNSVQYNNGGSFGGSANFTTDGSSVTVSTAIIGNIQATTVTLSGQSIAVMNTDAVGPAFSANGGYMDITGYYNTPSGALSGYKIGGSSTLRRIGGGNIYIGASNGGSAGNSLCFGDNACNSLGSSGTNNIAIGASALTGDSSGGDNTCTGAQSCFGMTSGQNSCYGAYSCGGNISGTANSVFGWDAGNNITSGSDNTCIGWDSCDLLSSGSSNTMFGDTAGADVTSGSRNTCIGGDTANVQPCQGIVSGSSNTAVGNGAGGNIAFLGTESADTALGYNASWGVGVRKSVCIGYNCVVNSSNTVQFGGTGADAVTINISSGMTLSGSAGTSGQVLQSNGPGTVPTWATPSAGGGGASTLGVNYNNVSITSPTAQINFVGSGVSVAANGSTATVTISGGSSTNQTRGVFTFPFSLADFTSSGSTKCVVAVASGTVTGWSVISDSGTVNFNAKSESTGTYASSGYPTTSQCGTDCPKYTTALYNENRSLSAWTTTFNYNDVWCVDVDSVTVSPPTYATVQIYYTKTQ